MQRQAHAIADIDTAGAIFDFELHSIEQGLQNEIKCVHGSMNSNGAMNDKKNWKQSDDRLSASVVAFVILQNPSLHYTQP